MKVVSYISNFSKCDWKRYIIQFLACFISIYISINPVVAQYTFDRTVTTNVDTGLYAIMSTAKNFVPIDYCVLTENSNGSYPIVVLGPGETQFVVDSPFVRAFIGWGLYRYLLDSNGRIVVDTAYVFEDSVLKEKYYGDLFFHWGECYSQSFTDSGILIYVGQHKIVVGQGKEARTELTPAFALRKAYIDKQGDVVGLVQVPLFKIRGYHTGGLDTVKVYGIAEPLLDSCEYNYGAAITDVEYGYNGNLSSYVLLWEFAGDSLFSVFPDSTPVLSRWGSSLCDNERVLVVSLSGNSKGGYDTFLYSSVWWTGGYLLDDNWFFYADFSDHLFFDLVLGDRKIAIRMPYSEILDTALGITTTQGQWFPIDSLANMYIVSLGDSLHYTGGVVYRISNDDFYSDVKVLQVTYRVIEPSSNDFARFCLAGLWAMDNRIVGDSVLESTITLAPFCAFADMLTLVPVVYWSGGDTVIEGIYFGDTLSNLDTVPMLLKLRFNFLEGKASLEIIDTTIGWYGALSNKANRVAYGSRMYWALWGGSLRSIGGEVERQHENFGYYRQRYRIFSPTFPDVAFLPALPTILDDGRMVTLVKTFEVITDDILIEDALWGGMSRPVREIVPGIWASGNPNGDAVNGIILMAIGCPRVDSAQVLQGLEVNYNSCNLQVSIDSLWDAVLGSIDTFPEGTLVLNIDFGDGCGYSYRFEDAFSDTTFVDLGYACGELRVSAFQSGNAMYYLYDSFDSLVAVNDSGVFVVQHPGLYYVVGIDTSSCVYQYSDSVEVTFVRSGGWLYQVIGAKDEVLIAGPEGLDKVAISSVAGDVSQVVQLVDLGPCSDECGERIHIYRLRIREKLPSGTYILNVSDRGGFTKPVKIVVQ